MSTTTGQNVRGVTVVARGNTIIAFFNELRQTQFRPPAWMIDYQRRLLEPLLRHARTQVPFYRDSGRLDPVFRADGGIDWDRWREIPPLTRKELQSNFEALKAETFPADDGPAWTLSTSGSTGEPVRVVHTFLARRVALTAQLLRDFERFGINPARRLAYLAPPSADWTAGAPPRRSTYWYPGLKEAGIFGERFIIADTQPPGTLIEQVISVRPDYMRVQPLALQLMCANDRDGRLSALKLGGVLTVGDNFSQDAKRDVALHLGTRIIDQYGSVECGRIATGCPHCGRFHVDAELNLVEVVGEDGVPTEPGGTGWLMVTPFYNFAMPLIRYEHADQAKVGETDRCEIKLPTIDEIYGKERDLFMFPGGHTIRATASVRTIVEKLGAQAFQIAQVAEDACEVRIVRGAMPRNAMRFDEMTDYLRSIWWSGLKVDYKLVESVGHPSRRGKVAAYVREWSPIG